LTIGVLHTSDFYMYLPFSFWNITVLWSNTTQIVITFAEKKQKQKKRKKKIRLKQFVSLRSKGRHNHSLYFLQFLTDSGNLRSIGVLHTSDFYMYLPFSFWNITVLWSNTTQIVITHICVIFSRSTMSIYSMVQIYIYIYIYIYIKQLFNLEVKVPRRSLWYATHHLMVMHPHTKYNWPI
jgi:hypothetical protein